MREQARILLFKSQARRYVQEKNWYMLENTIRHLEVIWKDEKAAKAFYAELEKLMEEMADDLNNQTGRELLPATLERPLNEPGTFPPEN